MAQLGSSKGKYSLNLLNCLLFCSGIKVSSFHLLLLLLLQEGAGCAKVAKPFTKAATTPLSCSFLFSSPDSPLSSCFRVVSNKTASALPHRHCELESGGQCSPPWAFPGPDEIYFILLRDSQQIKVVWRKKTKNRLHRSVQLERLRCGRHFVIFSTTDKSYTIICQKLHERLCVVRWIRASSCQRVGRASLEPPAD